MATIILLEFGSTKRHYELDLETREWRVREHRPSEEVTTVAMGYASLRVVGVFRRKKLFVGLYTDGKSLFLQAGSNRFCINSDLVSAKRIVIGPFVRRFVLRNCDEVLFNTDYWFIDWETWPDNGDIFSYIQTVLSTHQERFRAFVYWCARSEGIDTTAPEFLTKLERQVKGVSD